MQTVTLTNKLKSYFLILKKKIVVMPNKVYLLLNTPQVEFTR